MRGCRGRRDRPRGGAAARPDRPRSHRFGRGRRHRHRDLLAQQRGHSCRHLLPGRQLDGADVRVRQDRALSLLRRARHPLPELRQADRRHHAGGDRKAAGDPRPCRSQRRFGHADPVGGGRTGSGAGVELRRRAALTFHRHHRQPRLHAVAARRGGGGRRCVRLSHAADPRQGRCRPDRARDRRCRADDARLRSPDQRRRARRAGRGAQHRRDAAGTRFPPPISPRETISAAARGRRFRG